MLPVYAFRAACVLLFDRRQTEQTNYRLSWLLVYLWPIFRLCLSDTVDSSDDTIRCSTYFETSTIYQLHQARLSVICST